MDEDFSFDSVLNNVESIGTTGSVAPPPTFAQSSTPALRLETPQARPAVLPGNPILPPKSAVALEGLPAYKVAFLNAIAGPESRGAYNIRYTPSGGETFSSYDAHPNIRERGPAGPSTAAGRYQIVYSTWQGLKKDGLIPQDAPFTPEWQDRAALILAERRYKNTTGRELWGDLQARGFAAVAPHLTQEWAGLGANPTLALDIYNGAREVGPASATTQVAGQGAGGVGVAGRPAGATNPPLSPQEQLDAVMGRIGDIGMGGRIPGLVNQAPGVTPQTPAGRPYVAPMPAPQERTAQPVPGGTPQVPLPSPQGASPQEEVPWYKRTLDWLRTPTQPSSEATWGPGKNLVHGLTLHRGPETFANVEGANATRRAAWEGTPLKEAYQKGEQVTAAALPAERAAREEWAKNNGLMAGITDFAGSALPLVAGAGAVGAGLRGLGHIAPGAVPFLNFIGGPTGAGLAAKVGSGAVSGAWQGAGANALMGEDPWSGAAIGAGIGALTGPIFATASAPMRATARPDVARAAENAIANGVQVPGSAIIENAGTKKVIQALGGKGDAQTLEGFTSAVAKRFGADKEMAAFGAKGLTPEVMDAAKKRIGDGFDQFAKNVTVDVQGPAYMKLNQVVADAKRNVGPELSDAIEKYINDNVIGLSMNNPGQMIGKLTGDQFRYATNSSSDLKRLYADPNTVPYARRIEDILYDELERSVPGAKKEIQDLRKQWKIFRTVEPMAEKANLTGLLGPETANRFAKLGHDDLSQAARLMPSVDPSGAVKGESPGIFSFLKKHAGGGAIAGGIVAAHELGAAPSLLWQHPMEALGAAGALGGAHAVKRAYGNYLASPAYAQRVIQNTLRPQAGVTFNPLTTLGAYFAPNGLQYPQRPGE